MADVTGILWTDSTWNAWWGCQQAGPGCLHCYAEAMDKRTGGAHFGAKADRRRTGINNWNEPLRWQKKEAAFLLEHGHQRRVFVGSMMDIMDNAVPLEWSWDAFARIEECDKLQWLPLTKRVGNVPDRVPGHWQIGHWPRHVGLMITVVTQLEADRDIPKLLEWKRRFNIPWVGLSVEPLIEPINLDLDFEHAGIDWVIVGGESGPGARPFDMIWALSIVRQCQHSGVAVFVKQMGANVYSHGSMIDLKDRSHGGDMREWWASIRVRQFPRALL